MSYWFGSRRNGYLNKQMTPLRMRGRGLYFAELVLAEIVLSLDFRTVRLGQRFLGVINKPDTEPDDDGDDKCGKKNDERETFRHIVSSRDPYTYCP